jgi:hypothetical protein
MKLKKTTIFATAAKVRDDKVAASIQASTRRKDPHSLKLLTTQLKTRFQLQYSGTEENVDDEVNINVVTTGRKSAYFIRNPDGSDGEEVFTYNALYFRRRSQKVRRRSQRVKQDYISTSTTTAGEVCMAKMEAGEKMAAAKRANLTGQSLKRFNKKLNINIRNQCQLEYRISGKNVDDTTVLNSVQINGRRPKYYIRNPDGSNGDQIVTRSANSMYKSRKKQQIQEQKLKKKEKKEPAEKRRVRIPNNTTTSTVQEQPASSISLRIRFINSSAPMTPTVQDQPAAHIPRIRFINSSASITSTAQKQPEKGLKREREETEADKAISKRQKQNHREHSDSDMLSFDDSPVRETGSPKNPSIFSQGLFATRSNNASPPGNYVGLEELYEDHNIDPDPLLRRPQ